MRLITLNLLVIAAVCLAAVAVQHLPQLLRPQPPQCAAVDGKSDSLRSAICEDLAVE